MKTYYIYEITNLLNGKTYIGQRHCPSELTPWTDTKYMGSGVYIQNSEKKHGIENFSKRILAICYSQDVLDILERAYIKMYREIGKAEYNHADGGNSMLLDGKPWNYGIPISEEAKQKMRKTKLEHPMDKEVKKAITEKVKNYYKDENYRKNHSNKIKNKRFYESIHKPEYKEKLSEASKRMWLDQKKKKARGAKISQNTKGIRKSEQARKNISVAMRNSKKFKETMASEEHKNNLSKGIRNSKRFYDSHHNEHFIERMREIRKHNTPKQVEASKKFGKCCLGRKRYTTDSGKHTLEFPSKAKDNWILGWI